MGASERDDPATWNVVVVARDTTRGRTAIHARPPSRPEGRRIFFGSRNRWVGCCGGRGTLESRSQAQAEAGERCAHRPVPSVASIQV